MTIFLLLATILHTTIYEDAEDNSTSRWRLHNEDSARTISNIYNMDKKSRVLFLDSEDNQNGYILSMEHNSTGWCNSKGKSLRWSMSTDRDFVILISIQTKRGDRYIIYTSSDKNGRGYYGLGANSIDGEWHQFSRDLNLDLKRYEPTNQIVSVDSFFVRGSIKIDDIEIVDIEKIAPTPKKIKNYKVEIDKIKRLDIYDNKPPIITLNGDQILYIRLGSEYIEEGATAIDNVDGTVNVEISESVDIHRVGIYTLLYLAKDEFGNSSITTRIINVGDTSKQRIKVCEEENTTLQPELVILESVEDNNDIGVPIRDSSVIKFREEG